MAIGELTREQYTSYFDEVSISKRLFFHRTSVLDLGAEAPKEKTKENWKKSQFFNVSVQLRFCSHYFEA